LPYTFFDMIKQNISFRGAQRRVGKALAAIPLSPNQWTIIAVLVALVAGVMIAFYHDFGAGALLFIFAGLIDSIDGAVARARGQITKLGGFIDGLSDRVVEAIIIFSFMFYPLPTVIIDPKIWLAAALFFGTCIPSFVRAYAHHKEVMSKEEALALGGICERGERLIIMGLGGLGGVLYSMEFFVYAFILVSVLSLITIVQRLSRVVRSA